MDIIPALVPPLPRAVNYNCNVPREKAFKWLTAGWNDMQMQPSLSLAYGGFAFLTSWLVIWCLFYFGWGSVLFPALAAFLVVGPVLAVGLYEKSRRIALGLPLSLRAMIFVPARSSGQILFIGVVLALLMMVWMRAAFIIYALFFGMRSFPGIDHVPAMLFTTTTGWVMLVTGVVAGGLFAGFAFAISALSIPMVLDKNLDAFTAMGTSFALVWNNLPVMFTWGTIITGLFLLCLVTGFVGLIVVFPLLGHATWHAYRNLPAPQAVSS